MMEGRNSTKKRGATSSSLLLLAIGKTDNTRLNCKLHFALGIGVMCLIWGMITRLPRPPDGVLPIVSIPWIVALLIPVLCGLIMVTFPTQIHNYLEKRLGHSEVPREVTRQ